MVLSVVRAKPVLPAEHDLVAEFQAFRKTYSRLVIHEIRFFYGNGEGGPERMTMHILVLVKDTGVTLPKIVHVASELPNIWHVAGDGAEALVRTAIERYLKIEPRLIRFAHQNKATTARLSPF